MRDTARSNCRAVHDLQPSLLDGIELSGRHSVVTAVVGDDAVAVGELTHVVD